MLEMFLFLLAGIGVGIFFGLVPGLHPNFVVLLVPAFAALARGELVVFVAAMAVSNAIVSFLPSILLGAPDEGSELSVSPGHRMLQRGQGYQAVKLAVAGGLFSVCILFLLFPVVVFAFPAVYASVQPALFAVLVLLSGYMVFSEQGAKKIISLACFLLAGIVGLHLYSVPLDGSLVLFPVLSGLFGASILVAQLRQKSARLAAQRGEEYVSRRLMTRASFFGAIGGIFSGLLPGVGASQISAFASVDKNEKSFLVTMGAIATANIVVSIVSLWLIGKSRSGAAVVLENIVEVGFGDVLLVLFAALLSASVAALVALALTRKFLGVIGRLNYVFVSEIVLSFLAVLVFAFTGFYGLALFVVCAALGLFACLSQVRMSCLMGVLLVPTILFYYPF